MTDVTGFGLAGHLLEMCRGARLSAEIDFSRLPVIAEALQLVRDGVATGASTRNWASYGESVVADESMPEWQRKLITDPQTSGGLLIACAPEAVDEVLNLIESVQGNAGAVVGRMIDGAPQLFVR